MNLDARQVLGEEDSEDEQETSERLKQAEEDQDRYLVEELQFKSRVAAITRAQPTQQRMWLTPAVRFPHIADGMLGQERESVILSLDASLHRKAANFGHHFDFQALSHTHLVITQKETERRSNSMGW